MIVDWIAIEGTGATAGSDPVTVRIRVLGSAVKSFATEVAPAGVSEIAPVLLLIVYQSLLSPPVMLKVSAFASTSLAETAAIVAPDAVPSV